MLKKTVQFLNFEQAVAAAKSEPDTDFVGLRYVEPFSRLEVYVLNVDSDEPEYVNVNYEGGELFDAGGEEEFYDLDDVPEEAKTLCYARESDLPDCRGIRGMVAEHVLASVLPDLSPATSYSSKAAFIDAASEKFRTFWRQT